MTREEAITVLEGLLDNPLFSNQHKAAFNIAIHDIKQRHDWDINNLILVNKDDYESAEQESVLDKIRAEIQDIAFDSQEIDGEHESIMILELNDALNIIDKYKAESEENGNVN